SVSMNRLRVKPFFDHVDNFFPRNSFQLFCLISLGSLRLTVSLTFFSTCDTCWPVVLSAFILLTDIPTPLEDATNERNIGQKNKRRKNNGPTCIACREKSKRHSQAKRAKADETKQ